MLYLRSNVPDACLQDLAKFKTIHDIPEKMRSLFDKLCKTAFDMLKDNKLVMHEEEFGVVQDDLDSLQLKQFDGFGLLHIDHYTGKLATMETSYSFIHRAVQELLAAISLLNASSISDILDEYFYEGSYLINVFPFLFSLASKEFLRPLAKKLIQIFMWSNRSNSLFSSILYCLFEAHDETLCSEFGQVFSEKRNITVTLRTFLECHYVCYFISVCGVKKLNITIHNRIHAESCDLQCEILHKYLQNTSDIVSFCFMDYSNMVPSLSQEGMKELAKSLSAQYNLQSVVLFNVSFVPGCTTILFDSICKHIPQITELLMHKGELSENDLESTGALLTTCSSIEKLHMVCSPSKGICLDLSQSFCKALCETKSLQILLLPDCTLSQADSKVFGNIISQNCSLKELCIRVASADCLDPILNGLSLNTSITTFKVLPMTSGASNELGQCFKTCLTLNQSVNIIDLCQVYIVNFTSTSFRYFESLVVSCVLWSSTQVSSICTGLCANTTLVTLDITGCYIDTEACCDVCNMLSQNKILQKLFLNPVHLEKQEAVAMIDSCRANDTLQLLLSLVQWPPKRFSGDREGKDPFQYSCDPVIMLILKQTESHLKVYWLVSTINHLSFACRKSSQIL